MSYFGDTKKGFTLIEGIVAIAVFVILITVFYKIFSQSVTHLSESKYRRAAVALVNERMEHYRNLPYEDVGTIENAPFGEIIDDEVVKVNDMSFRIVSSVFFVDDPVDGSAPIDTLFEDYKRVRVSVLWGEGINENISKSDAEYSEKLKRKRIELVSQFVPPGGMETAATGGILSINVLDSDAVPISDAQVTIYDSVNDTTITESTDDTGNYMYVGAPECQSCYEVEVEKSGYEIISTEESYNGTMQIYDPRFVHQSVIVGELTTTVLHIDKVSLVNVSSQNPHENVVADVNFDVVGGRVLTDPNNDGANVYNFSDSLVTDENGEIVIRTDTNNDSNVDDSDDSNPGPYFFTLNESGYVFWKMIPGDENDATQLNILSDTGDVSKMIVLDENYDSVFIRVVDSDGVPISLATVRMINSSQGYDVELETDDYGYVFFPENDMDILQGGEIYDITVNAEGYEENIDSVEIDELVEYEIILLES